MSSVGEESDSAAKLGTVMEGVDRASELAKSADMDPIAQKIDQGNQMM
jgi:hypothetical protein